jgi:serine/threonine-protein kinase
MARAMGLLDLFKKNPFSTMRRSRVHIGKRFEVLRTAISGSMSKFYMARDRENDDVIGLKVADPKKSKLFESRFKELKKPVEGEIAMAIEHPYVVKTLEHGITRDREAYIVMEYIEGPGLHNLIYNNDSILDGKRLNLIRQMAEALGAVHDAGFVHRDVCPRNYICNLDGESIKLFDFGLTLPDKHSYRQPGNRTGTPLYMAPEVVRRKWTDRRLDIFSLGVTLYELCTFTLPWPKTETSGLAALAHDTDKPKEILELKPDLNQKIAAAIMKCISADADDRFGTIPELLTAIQDCQHENENG